jgi:hypothetical protein
MRTGHEGNDGHDQLAEEFRQPLRRQRRLPAGEFDVSNCSAAGMSVLWVTSVKAENAAARLWSSCNSLSIAARICSWLFGKPIWLLHPLL